MGESAPNKEMKAVQTKAIVEGGSKSQRMRKSAAQSKPEEYTETIS